MGQTLATATLSDVERRIVQRIVAMAREEFGDRLFGVWLFGSRARGERPHDESDVDLLIIVDDPGVEASDARVDMGWAAAEAEGASPIFVDVRQFSRDWLENRRQIRSFFMQEVDRDKIVLYGSP